MISINNVRNLVLFFLNKNNKGNIGVEQFNSFCNMAQLDLFENLFYQYNQWINRQNNRKSGTEYADIPKNLREQIDVFASYSTNSNFTYNSTTGLWGYAGNDLYRVENLSLVNGIKKVDIEEVKKIELNYLNRSKDAMPTLLFPVYEKIGSSFKIYPELPSGYTCEMFYIRKPKYPKWTFIEVDGDPIYNPSASDLQDIELHISMYSALVAKVLAYCGLSIRETEVTQAASQEEIKNLQKQV